MTVWVASFAPSKRNQGARFVSRRYARDALLLGQEAL
jgi:hypothetical protein